MYLTAPHILPIEGPRLSPGVVKIRGDRIEAIGTPDLLKNRLPSDKLIELADCVLIPGFVNAHCHLELTALGPIVIPFKTPGPTGPRWVAEGGGPPARAVRLRRMSTMGEDEDSLPAEALAKAGTRHSDGEGFELGSHLSQVPFVPWIQEVVRRKNELTDEEKKEGIQRGINDLLQSGVTSVGDHLSFNTPWEVIVHSPLRGRLFGEVLGIIPEVCEDIYRTLRKIKNDFEKPGKRFTFHVSPHSVHAVHPLILKQVLAEEEAPLSCHLAESHAEEDYFRKNKGPLADLIRDKGAGGFHQARSAIDYLVQNKLPLEKLLLVHGNYLDDRDLEMVSKSRLSIVHCPGSHNYFGHQKADLEKWRADGINIALGTDSVASNRELNFLGELRQLRDNFPSFSPDEILAMATLNGARALRMDQEIGSLVPGKKADIAGFRIKSAQSPEEAILTANRVNFVMIDGKEV